LQGAKKKETGESFSSLEKVVGSYPILTWGEKTKNVLEIKWETFFLQAKKRGLGKKLEVKRGKKVWTRGGDELGLGKKKKRPRAWERKGPIEASKRKREAFPEQGVRTGQGRKREKHLWSEHFLGGEDGQFGGGSQGGEKETVHREFVWGFFVLGVTGPSHARGRFGKGAGAVKLKRKKERPHQGTGKKRF